jgi:hypothetical protein
MHIPKRILRLAKDRALSSFSALAEQTVVEADTMATRAMSEASSLVISDLNTVRSFLRAEARTLRGRMDRHFAGLLDRSMLTMHTDLRTAGTQEINYETLTLIDDDVVTRQIEVDRMVGRLRDAEPIALGRVNLTIAMIHNDSDARERENPFRPYLLARSLYEALRELMWDEAQSKLLFDALSTAMANRLPGFYAGILEVFEAGGLTARLVARPTAMSRSERERMAWQRAAKQMLDGGDADGNLEGGVGKGGADDPLHRRLVPKLERLKEIERLSAGDGMATKGQGLIDVVWNIFHQPKSARRVRPKFRGDGERSDLDTALFELQQEIAAGNDVPAPLDLREKIGEVTADADQRRTMDVVALLFESIVHDELLGPPMQREMSRLYVPILRAALVEPELLHDAEHPVRRLLDRLGSVAVGFTPNLPGYDVLVTELHGIVGALLDLFDDDMNVFADAEHAFDGHVAELLAASDPRIAPCVEAIEDAVASSARLAGCGVALSAALQPLQIDPRVADFILGTWARVLSHSVGGDPVSIALLPELLWSAQEKTTPEDRTAMMRMLPELVRKVREGMAAIALPEAPSKAAFDRLVAVHMDVLGNKQAPARRQLTLAQFREHFAEFSIDGDPAGTARDNWVGKFELEAALLQRGIDATLQAKSAAPRLPQSSDADWLAWARPGAGFEIRSEGRYQAALLCSVTSGGSAFLFTIAGQEAPAIYLRGPLLEGLENSNLRPFEYAPLFDRAVESLMAGAESMTA